jgi:hypothetical protein
MAQKFKVPPVITQEGTDRRQETDRREMKRAKLRLLEVLGLLRMPGEGDVTAIPLFR